MPQPSFAELFGVGSNWDAVDNSLQIPLSALQQSGLSANPPSALEVYSALIKTAHTWLSANTDATVLATSDLTVQAPIVRNGQPRTQFQFSARFYGAYNAPEFDPDQI